MDEQLSQQVTRLRKSGQLMEAWDIACPAVQQNPNDTYLKGAFFWVCYGYLKETVAPLKERAQGNGSNYAPNHAELERINFLLDWIIWLEIPAGGYEYRSLLLLFQKNLESVPKLVLLLAKFGADLFNEEDKQPYQGEKGESPSLMLKYTRKVAKAWVAFEEVRQISVEQLLMMFDLVRSQAKDKQHLIWLDYDEAKCLIMAGRFEQAREFVIPVLQKKQTESWAWGALAATYRKQDVVVAITLFAKGLCCAHDEKFALPLLKGLAPLLAGSGHIAEASMCVQRAMNCYESNGWKIKSDLEKLCTQPWFDASVGSGDLGVFLERESATAMDLLHGPSEQCVAIISNVHQSGKGFHAYRDQARSYSVRLGLYKSKDQPKPGEYVRLTLGAKDEAVITVEPCNAEVLRDVGFEQGEIRVAAKGFGFVNDTFVPPHLIGEGADGQLVNIVKIMDFDKTKNKPAWKAIALQRG